MSFNYILTKWNMYLMTHFKLSLPVTDELIENVPCPLALARPQELSSHALFGLSYLDDPCCVPPKSNLLYLVHTLLSLFFWWQQVRWYSYLHCVFFFFLGSFPMVSCTLWASGNSCTHSRFKVFFSWQESALLTFWVTVYRVDMQFS